MFRVSHVISIPYDFGIVLCCLVFFFFSVCFLGSGLFVLWLVGFIF